MTELICMFCEHSRRRHSREGCTHTRKNMKQCTCKEVFTDRSNFIEGTPKDD